MKIFQKITVWLAMAGILTALATLVSVTTTSAADCDANAVMFCGADSTSSVINKYEHGDGHNSASSIHHIYSSFAISSADIHSMNSSAQNGRVNSNGDVFVGDNLVATGAMTAGRQDISNSCGRSRKINNHGTTFFTRAPCVSFASSSLSAFVVLKNGVFKFAILSSCGNPVVAKPKMPAPTPQPAPKTPIVTPPAAPQPTTVNVCSGDTTNINSGIASQGGNCSSNTTVVQTQKVRAASPSGQCTSLQLIVDSTDRRTVTAVVAFQTFNGAQLQSITYNFGDGVTLPATTQTSMTHTYQVDGTFIVEASLIFTGAQAAPSNCQAQITVGTPTPPPTVTTSQETPTPSVASTPASTLVNTGAGNVIGIFLTAASLGTLGYRFYLRRLLSRDYN